MLEIYIVWAGVPNLQDLMPDNPRWGWCNNRNKVHSKCNVLESSQNHPLYPGPWKNYLPQKQSLVSKRLGTTGLERHTHMQMILNLWWFNLQFFTLTMVWKQYTFNEGYTSNFECWCFHAPVMRGMMLSYDVVQWQWVGQPHSWYTCNYCIPRKPVFTFSTLFNKLHEIFKTYYKIGFVLDDFTQL